MQNSFALSLILVFFLGACSIFEQQEERRLPGERIPALAQQQTTIAAVSTQAIRLPEAYRNQAWPQAGGAPNNANHHLALSREVASVWEASLGNSSDKSLKVLAQPIVVDDVLYALNNRYEILAFDAHDGTLLWRDTLF
ncbi:MAG: hypothetical protein AAF352_09175, partial [Pseudomonadota bacterium]